MPIDPTIPGRVNALDIGGGIINAFTAGQKNKLAMDQIEQDRELQAVEREIGVLMSEGRVGEAKSRAYRFGLLRTGQSIEDRQMALQDRQDRQRRQAASDARAASADARKRQRDDAIMSTLFPQQAEPAAVSQGQPQVAGQQQGQNGGSVLDGLDETQRALVSATALDDPMKAAEMALEFQGEARERATEQAETERTEANRRQFVEQTARTAITSIDEAIQLSTGSGDPTGVTGTTGLLSTVTGLRPGSPTRRLEAKLDTIRALVGFDQLQKLREMSPTGGALGQVTERELAFLQSVQGSLDRLQGEQDLDVVLNRIRESYQRLLDAVHQEGGAINPVGGSEPQAPAADIDSLIDRYAD